MKFKILDSHYSEYEVAPHVLSSKTRLFVRHHIHTRYRQDEGVNLIIMQSIILVYPPNMRQLRLTQWRKQGRAQ